MIDLTSDKIRTDVIRRKFYSEDDSFFKKLNITKNNYLSPLGINIYLVELSDGYYYMKKADERACCNEIVGRYLCNKIGLETTQLDLLLDRGKLKIATPNYRKEELKYQRQKDDIELAFHHQYSVSKLKILPKAYQKEQFKLITIDMMMEQTDRCSDNMEEELKNNSRHLAPIIDFVESFDYYYYCYYNPYVSIPKDIENIDRFLNDFPEAYKYFLEIFDIDSNELINYIETNYPIKVDNETKERYESVTSKNKRLLKTIR